MQYQIKVFFNGKYLDAYLYIYENRLIIKNDIINIDKSITNLTNCILDKNTITLFFNQQQIIICSNNLNQLKLNIDNAKRKSNQLIQNNNQSQKHISKNNSILLAIIGILFFFSLCFSLVMVSTLNNKDDIFTTETEILENTDEENKTEENIEEISTEETTEKPILTEKEQFIEDISKSENEYNNTEVGYEKLYDLLSNDMHFKEIKFKSNYRDSYTVSVLIEENWLIDTRYNIDITMTNDNILYISCGSYDLYKDNEILMTFEDVMSYYVSTETETNCMAIARFYINDCLVSPKSANYSNFSVIRHNNLYVVTGTVESQNAFGVYIKNDFVIQFFSYDTSSYNAEIYYLQLGNEATGQYIDMK